MSDDGLFKFNINKTGGDIAVSKEYPVFSTKGLNSVFLLAKLNDGSDFKQFALSQKAGGTRTRLYFSRLCEWCTLLPSPAEQQKIADCLSSLDELITAETQNLDALKTHKKGLMQQLFPREGETVPRLRFPEFRGAGEWEEMSIEEIAPLQRGFDLPSSELQPGTIPVVYSNGVQNFHSKAMAKAPGLMTGRSGTIGKLHFVENGEYWPHNTSLWVTSFKGNIPKFVYFLFNSIGIERFASGSGVPTLNRNDVHGFMSAVPKSPAEQQKVADCLSSFDDIITAQSRRIDSLKTHKQGLTQQLFPVLDEVLA
jgi:type I restriction enzyme S subunit